MSTAEERRRTLTAAYIHNQRTDPAALWALITGLSRDDLEDLTFDLLRIVGAHHPTPHAAHVEEHDGRHDEDDEEEDSDGGG